MLRGREQNLSAYTRGSRLGGAKSFWEERNNGANTFSEEKHDGADTFLGNRNGGARTFLNDGVKTFLE